MWTSGRCRSLIEGVEGAKRVEGSLWWQIDLSCGHLCFGGQSSEDDRTSMWTRSLWESFYASWRQHLKETLLSSFSSSFLYFRCLLAGLHALMFKKTHYFLILSVAAGRLHCFSPVHFQAPCSLLWLVSSHKPEPALPVSVVSSSGVFWFHVVLFSHVTILLPSQLSKYRPTTDTHTAYHWGTFE